MKGVLVVQPCALALARAYAILLRTEEQNERHDARETRQVQMG